MNNKNGRYVIVGEAKLHTKNFACDMRGASPSHLVVVHTTNPEMVFTATLPEEMKPIESVLLDSVRFVKKWWKDTYEVTLTDIQRQHLSNTALPGLSFASRVSLVFSIRRAKRRRMVHNERPTWSVTLRIYHKRVRPEEVDELKCAFKHIMHD